MYIQELVWQHYQNLPHISRLPLNEQIRLYNLYLMEVAEAKVAYLHHEMANPTSLGGGSDVVEDEAGSGTLVFNGLDPQSGGSYVSAPGSTIGNWLPGTDDFTVEWFQYQTIGGGHPRVFSIGPDTSAVFGVSIEGNKVYTWPSGNNWSIGTTYVNTWVHIAVVRSSGVVNTFVNGTKKATNDQADTTDLTGTTYDFYIGADGLTSGDGFPGNITNFRWTNSAVYSSNFTTPTSPLTQLEQTKLLLLGGTIAKPATDATKINTLTNYNTTWSSDTPFV